MLSITHEGFPCAQLNGGGRLGGRGADAPRATLADLVEELTAEGARAHEAYKAGIASGPVTRFPFLDRSLGGAIPVGLHVVTGSPGVGKTAVALQVAASCGCPALYLTVEMRMLQLFRRMIARETRTYLGRLRSGELPPATLRDLALRTARAAPGVMLLDGGQHHADADRILDSAELIRADHRHVLLIVDSVHAWAEGRRGGATEYEAIGSAIQGLTEISTRLACPILMIAQRNRAAMSQGGLHAAAGHRAFEYAAETVISLDAATPESGVRGRGSPAKAGLVPDEPRPGERLVMVTIEKNRDGTPGPSAPLWFNGAVQSFREATEEGSQCS